MLILIKRSSHSLHFPFGIYDFVISLSSTAAISVDMNAENNFVFTNAIKHHPETHFQPAIFFLLL